MSFLGPVIASAVSRVPWLPIARSSQSSLFPVSRSARFYGFGKQAIHGVIPASKHGIGYTGGAYLGYGVSNSVDPFGISRPKYKRPVEQSLKMPYGYYRRYRRYRRYGRRYGYRRRSYYRRRYY
jgi:hypothetical protein